MKVHITNDGHGKKVSLTLEAGDNSVTLGQFFKNNEDVYRLDISFFSNIDLNARSALLLQLINVLNTGHKADNPFSRLKHFCCKEAVNYLALTHLLNLPVMQTITSLSFINDPSLNIIFDATPFWNSFFVEYLQNNTALTSLTIHDEACPLIPPFYPNLKKALCQHKNLTSFTQGKNLSGTRDRLEQDTEIVSMLSKNKEGREFFAQPDMPFNMPVVYPPSYTLLANKGDTPLNKAKALLEDYTKHDSTLSRFFHSHWNRHHVREVNQWIESIEKGHIKTVEVLINSMSGIPSNPEGSLARRMHFIEAEILTQEQADYDVDRVQGNQS